MFLGVAIGTQFDTAEIVLGGGAGAFFLAENFKVTYELDRLQI